MSLKKTVAIAAAAGALAAVAVPAMAFENEVHGMYRAYGYFTNALSGAGTFNLVEKSRTDKYFEQRARLQYIAKASDDLRLVTHFELDTKFGGSVNAKYANAGSNGLDAGNLDADRVTLETKNVYLDFKIPGTPVRAAVGIQPFSDALAGTFSNFDATGAAFTGKFGALTATYGYYTIGNSGSTATATFESNRATQDMNVLDLKFALSKDITVGTSYYMLLDKVGFSTFTNNTLGLNAAAKVGPAALAATLGFQFGRDNTNMAFGANTSTAFGATLAAKINLGPGKVRLSGLFLSGDRNGTGHNHAWQSPNTGTNYFVPADMWLITRNGATINSSTAIGGSADLTRGGLGIMGAFAGYEGAAGKVFYNANVGHANVAEKRTAKSSVIGTEMNATVGYKLYNNLTTSFTAAYAILGDGYKKDSATAADRLNSGGASKADNPFMTNIALNYSF